MFSKLNNRSIQSRIMSLLVIMSITLILTLGFVFYNNTVERVKDSKRREMTTLAIETSNKIERFLFERAADIKVLATSNVLNPSKVTASIQLEYLQNVVKAYQTYDEIFVLDTLGKIVLSTRESLTESEIEPYLSKFLSGDSYVSDFIVGEGSYAYFSEPIEIDGTVVGVVVEKMNFDVIDEIIANVRIGAHGHASMRMLNQEDALEKVVGIQESYNLKDRVKYLSATYPVVKYPSQSEQWVLTVSQPVEEAFGVIHDIERYFGIVIMIFLVVFFIFSKIVSMSVTKPIRQLKQKISEILDDHKLYATSIGTSDEVKHLTSTFDFLLEELNFMMQKVLEASGEAAYVKEIKKSMSNLFEHMPNGIMTIDGRGEITSMNPAAVEMLRHNFVGCNIFKERPKQYEGLFENIASSMSNDISQSETLCIQSIDNYDVKIVISTLKQMDINEVTIGMTVILQNLEEKQKFEASVVRAKRLSELGVLSAGVAHEVRNPLASIKGYAQLVKSELAPDEQATKDLEIVLSEVERLDKIIDRFMTFASPNQPEYRENHMDRLIVDVLHLLTQKLEEQNVEVFHQLRAGAGVFFDYDQMKQVLINVVLNAIQAMPKGGTIKIETRITKLLEIEITDNGEGMSSEMMEKVFAPFYTTRQEGTGLGLSICSRIVESHDGIFEIQSKLGVGTQISIKLPVERKDSIL